VFKQKKKRFNRRGRADSRNQSALRASVNSEKLFLYVRYPVFFPVGHGSFSWSLVSSTRKKVYILCVLGVLSEAGGKCSLQLENRH
jgi:hypothetical protein